MKRITAVVINADKFPGDWKPGKGYTVFASQPESGISGRMVHYFFLTDGAGTWRWFADHEVIVSGLEEVFNEHLKAAELAAAGLIQSPRRGLISQ